MNDNIEYIVNNQPIVILNWGTLSHKLQLLIAAPTDIAVEKGIIEIVEEPGSLKVEIPEPSQEDGQITPSKPIIYHPENVKPIFLCMYRHKENLITLVGGIDGDQRVESIQVKKEFKDVDNVKEYIKDIAEEINAEYFFDSFDACVATDNQKIMLTALSKSSSDADKEIVMMRSKVPTIPMGDFSDIVIKPNSSLNNIEIGQEGANIPVTPEQLGDDFVPPEVQVFQTDNVIIYSYEIPAPQWYNKVEQQTILYCYAIKNKTIERVFFDDVEEEVYNQYILKTVNTPKMLSSAQDEIPVGLNVLNSYLTAVVKSTENNEDITGLLEEAFKTLDADSKLLFTKALAKSPPLLSGLSNPYMSYLMKSKNWKEFMLSSNKTVLKDTMEVNLATIYSKLHPEFTEKVLSDS